MVGPKDSRPGHEAPQVILDLADAHPITQGRAEGHTSEPIVRGFGSIAVPVLVAVVATGRGSGPRTRVGRGPQSTRVPLLQRAMLMRLAEEQTGLRAEITLAGHYRR